jgi:hypothetical protein
MKYDEKRIRKVLSAFKSYYGEDKPKRGYGSWYDFDIPNVFKSLGYPERFLQALLKHNIQFYEIWDDPEYKIVIPQEKTFDVVVDWMGRQYLTKTYGHRIDAFDKDDIEDMISNCDPCYDEGDEMDVDYGDSDGEWNITSFEQITESDYQRIKSKLLIKESDKDNSKEEKLMRFLNIYMDQILDGGVWYDDENYWFINPETKEWIFEYRKKTKYVFFYRKYFEIIQDLTGMKSPITTELKKILTKWVSKKFGFNVEDVIPYYSEEKATVRDVLQKNNRWEEMN